MNAFKKKKKKINGKLIFSISHFNYVQAYSMYVKISIDFPKDFIKNFEFYYAQWWQHQQRIQ